MKSLNDIRTSFLDYFKANGHEVLPSSPLVPHDDPSLMFTNAGMNQFKNVFTGLEQLPYKCAASAQKCVRAGGKHNDLENVGYTARHHTFFEMLGNFSFGDYFKDEAIKFAWEFLTKTLKLPKDKLYVTVYHTDDEAFKLWKKIAALSDDRIIRIPTSDNFWAMGDTGPCGPCSEIFYDHGPKIAGGLPGTKDADGDRYIEIWNLVFMQYEQLAEGKRVNLPRPSIDTGMGLERTTAVLQGVHSNYEIDLFKHLIEASEELTKGGDIISHRIIADHLRSSCFLIADGVMPSNEGRGYVLRRIMRRAMRYAYNLGAKDALMYKLVPALISQMGIAYPELKRAEGLITEVLKLEEEKFRETLGRGLKLLEEETSKLKNKTLPGEVAFKLYDTYGFPLDLTADILRVEGKKLDEAGFEKSMQEQRERARVAWKGSGEKATDEVWFDIKQEFGATEFLGYTTDTAQAKVVAIVRDDKKTDAAKKGDKVGIVTNQTPFYAESGGQVGDSGFLEIGNQKSEIRDTKKMLGELHVHMAELHSPLKTDDVVTLTINSERRDALRANHSATHLLHKVLREQLGAHITQKGSLVAEDKLRFDFSHNKGLSPEEIVKIEDEVNKRIRENHEVGTKLMKADEAVSSGAMALFGEKYGDEVRVLSMGDSIELCGGTHVTATGDIGFFKIISEGAIASGVRRIEAVTGEGAVKYVQAEEALVNNLAGMLKVAPNQLYDRIETLLNERKKLEKELADAKRKGAGEAFDEETVSGVTFISKRFEDLSANDMRAIAEDLRKAKNNCVIAFFGVNEGKVSIVVAVSDNLKDKINAANLVKIAAEATGGKGGGGRPELAQAGGSDERKIGAALAAIRSALSA
jgi:alanyl-tRNA synthetase